MRSEAWASFRAAAPPEYFGEPDDFDAPEQPRCRRCGAFASWKPTQEGQAEHHFGEIVWFAVWNCGRCGAVIDQSESVVGKVYGPLPPWSDPYMVRTENGEWRDYHEMEMEAWAADEADRYGRDLDGEPVGADEWDDMDDLPF